MCVEFALTSFGVFVGRGREYNPAGGACVVNLELWTARLHVCASDGRVRVPPTTGVTRTLLSRLFQFHLGAGLGGVAAGGGGGGGVT